MHALAERVRQPRHLRLFGTAPTGQGGPCQPSGTTASTFLAPSERRSQYDEDRGCLSPRIMEDLVMDAKRFDTIAKALISETNRRRTLSGLLGGALATLGLSGADETDAAKSGKCKRSVDFASLASGGNAGRLQAGRRSVRRASANPRRMGCSAPAPGEPARVEPASARTGRRTVARPVVALTRIARMGRAPVRLGPRNAVADLAFRFAPRAHRRATRKRAPVASSQAYQSARRLVFPFQAPFVARNSAIRTVLLPLGACAPGPNGTPCNINAQCSSNNCENGLCAA